jgi:hypothetical protein
LHGKTTKKSTLKWTENCPTERGEVQTKTICNYEKIHIGKLIQQKMKEDGRKVSWLAEKMPCNRNNIYRIYKSDNIDIKSLMRINKHLKINIFELLADITRNEIQDIKEEVAN